MTNEVSLRQVQESDLPIFFEQQLDPEAGSMAAFPARPHDAFMAHWKKVMTEGAGIVRTIIFQGNVAGNIGSWESPGERRLGYWLGKEYWGKGIASAALAQFLEQVKARPLHARVAKHNAASIRVLQKCAFTICGEERFAGPDGEQEVEVILILEANEQIKAE
jgi:RimJ/RimL family protein N-acetyltransferase